MVKRSVTVLGALLVTITACVDGGGDSTNPPITDGSTTATASDSGGETVTPATTTEDTDTPPDGGGPATDPQGPDLQLFTLPECSVVPNGALSGADGLTIFVAVRNGGPGNLSRLVPVAMDSDSGLGSRSNNAISTGSSFNPLQVDLPNTAYSRTHRFTITADPDNEIVERDESNNAIDVTVRLPGRPASATDVPCTSP